MVLVVCVCVWGGGENVDDYDGIVIMMVVVAVVVKGIMLPTWRQ